MASERDTKEEVGNLSLKNHVEQLNNFLVLVTTQGGGDAAGTGRGDSDITEGEREGKGETVQPLAEKLLARKLIL